MSPSIPICKELGHLLLLFFPWGICQFPLWWFGMPAMLKGYIEQVFAPGKFFDADHMYEKGFMHGRKAMLSLTTGATADAYI